MDAVWHVVLNRITDRGARWPRSIHTCILAGDTSTNQSYPQEQCEKSWKEFLDACDVVSTALGDDPTKGGNYFCWSNILPLEPQTATLTCEISPFKFYRV